MGAVRPIAGVSLGCIAPGTPASCLPGGRVHKVITSAVQAHHGFLRSFPLVHGGKVSHVIAAGSWNGAVLPAGTSVQVPPSTPVAGSRKTVRSTVRSTSPAVRCSPKLVSLMPAGVPLAAERMQSVQCLSFLGGNCSKGSVCDKRH